MVAHCFLRLCSRSRRSSILATPWSYRDCSAGISVFLVCLLCISLQWMSMKSENISAYRHDGFFVEEQIAGPPKAAVIADIVTALASFLLVNEMYQPMVTDLVDGRGVSCSRCERRNPCSAQNPFQS
ncbi:hypothetical protein GQ600_25172 [Phytophthora cactorum]|nr:hypothetical protein GQ600_25172 [Phytophthora cactorum]